MWVVKLGGSLGSDSLLPQWLELLAQLGGGRVAIVCGGGTLADEVRRAQARWRFDDLAAHNMAVLAMAQMAYQLQAMSPALQLVARRADIDSVLRRGRTAVWLPLELQRDVPDARTHWGATADTIAFDLARELDARRLTLVKSCSVDPAHSLAQLGMAGVIDAGLAEHAGDVAFPIEVMGKGELARMRALLLGQPVWLHG